MINFSSKCVMLDVETLGIIGRPIVIAIGLVYFDEGNIRQRYKLLPSIIQSMELGFDKDRETIKWWTKEIKRKVVYQTLTRKRGRHDLKVCFNFVKEVLESAEYHWAQGPDFDYVNVEHYMDALNIKHRRFALRDSRTMEKMFGKDKSKIEGDHDPVNDCVSQILKLQTIVNKLNISFK